MPAYAHTPAELAALEDATGLHFMGYLDPGDGGPLLPILGSAGQAARWHQRRRRVLALNGRDPGPVEAEPPPAAA